MGELKKPACQSGEEKASALLLVVAMDDAIVQDSAPSSNVTCIATASAGNVHCLVVYPTDMSILNSRITTASLLKDMSIVTPVFKIVAGHIQ